MDDNIKDLTAQKFALTQMIDLKNNQSMNKFQSFQKKVNPVLEKHNIDSKEISKTLQKEFNAKIDQIKIR